MNYYILYLWDFFKDGNRISDTTDMIADQDWDNFADEICDAIESK